MSLPGASHALGLGEIHVDSALNEPLSAEIDIVGASAEELSGITAAVANRDTFLHFGAERHNFLQSTTFKVGQDAHGRPVLTIRSTESFTEPLVDLVVDLRWRNGELIRQYSLLLDPAGFPSAARAAQALPTPASRPSMPAPLVDAPRPETAARNAPVIAPRTVRAAQAVDEPAAEVASTDRKTIKVGAKATLRGIAWRVGARSRPDINRLMLAIFRANPAAFDGNINRMHLGASLTIPAADEVAAIPQADANREIRSQMSSWLSTWKGASLAQNPTSAPATGANVGARAMGATAPAALPAPGGDTSAPMSTVATTPAPQSAPVARQPAPAVPATAAAPLVAAPPAAAGTRTADDMSNAELTERIKQLETSLRDMQAQLETEHSKMLNLQSQARYAEQHPTAPPREAVPAGGKPGHGYLGMLIAGVAVLLGALGAFVLRSRRTPPPRPVIPLEPMPEALIAPLAAPKPTYSTAPTAQPTPAVAAPATAAAAATPLQTRAIDDSLLELSQLEPSADLSTELGIDQPVRTESESHAVDTRGIDAARMREDAATARMRAELEAAWSIPAAEEYQRFDETETTLAEAIERSMADTARLRATQITAEDQVDTAATAKNKALDDTLTGVGPGETVVMEADTTKLPAATLAMHAEEIARAFEDPTVQQPRPELDFNLLELDPAAVAPGALHDHVVVKDRRSTPIETLKKDLEREPARDDLRLRALENYVEQAAAGREYAQVIDELTQVRELLSEAEWNKANEMLKQSRNQKDSDEDLFAA